MKLDLKIIWEEIMKSIMKLWLVSAISLFIALPAFSADVTMRISLQLPLKVTWDRTYFFSKKRWKVNQVGIL